MFDEQDYYSDEEENLNVGKHTPAHKVLLPNSGSDFNHLTGEGESLLKMMKDRGLDVNENQIKKLKVHNSSRDKEGAKSKQKAGFFDGGSSATFQQLLKALNRSLSSADPQQASAILSHILEKKTLTESDRYKFGIMKCKILFGLGAYQDCQVKAETFLQQVQNNYLVAATFSNYLAKSRAESGMILDGYMDLLRAKAYVQEEQDKLVQKKEPNSQSNEFKDSQIDTLIREIDHTEMEYNIKMSKFKNATNLVHPYFQQFRHRNVIQIACGDYHTLFLVAGAINSSSFANFEVMGLGENTVGQILGKPSKEIIKEPLVIVELSGKKITGITASRQSSLAWDQKGQIYEWGIKQSRDEQIKISYSINEKISQLEKGYQHYGCLTVSGKFYTWGNILYKGTPIIKQQQPYLQPAQGIANISCGLNHIVSVDKYGDAFVLGSNESGQLGLEGEMHSKTFKKFNNNMIGPLRKVFCILDASFFVTKEEELYIVGKISHNKDPIERLRQGQFGNDIKFITSLVGNVGNYYLTDEKGTLYHWEVDSSVKFKIEKENQKIAQRYVQASRGSLYKVRSLIVPEMTRVKLISEDLRSYENIQFQISLFDRFGPYGNSNFVMAPRCQLFFSTYAIKAGDLQKQNKQFIESYQFSNDDSNILLNEIIQSRLSSFKLTRNQEAPEQFKLTIMTQESGKFYFYMIIEDKIVYSQELAISVSEREKQLSDKNKKQKQVKEDERKKKIEADRQRIHDEKLRKQAEEEERRKDTQKRAEETFKKHMREQEELKMRAQEDRKARKQLMTGGGFDLSKLKSKNQKLQQPSDQMIKTNESFLPDINVRPSSKRKLNLPSKNSAILSSFESVKPFDKFSSKIEDLNNPGLNLFKTQSGKDKQVQKVVVATKGADSLNKTGGLGTGKMVLKRGLSKGKK